MGAFHGCLGQCVLHVGPIGDGLGVCMDVFFGRQVCLQTMQDLHTSAKSLSILKCPGRVYYMPVCNK